MMDDYNGRDQAQTTTLRDYVRVFFKRKWLVLGVWAVVTVAGFVVFKGEKQVYVTTAKAQIRETESVSIPIEEEFPELFKNDPGYDLGKFNSPEVGPLIIEQWKKQGKLDEALQRWFKDREAAPIKRETRIKVMENEIRPPYVLVTGKGNLDFTGRNQDPLMAQMLANGCLDAFRDYYSNKFMESYDAAYKVFGNRIKEASKALEQNQQKLEEFLSNSPPPDVASIDLQLESLKDDMDAVQTRMGAAKREIAALDEQADEIKMILRRGDPDRILLYVDGTSSIHDEALAAQTALREIARLRSEGKSDGHFQVKNQQKRLEAAQDLLKQEVDKVLQSDDLLAASSFAYAGLLRDRRKAQAEVDAGEDRLLEIQNQRQQLNASRRLAASDAQSYDHNRTTLQNAIANAQARLGESKGLLDKIKTSAEVRAGVQVVEVREEARVPGKPITGSWEVKVVFACIAGLVLGILAAFALDLFDYTFDRSESIEKELGLPVLASFHEEKKS